MKLVIVDYGSGNLRSVKNALQTAAHNADLPHQIMVSSDPDIVATAEYLVLPGVGAFADCKANLIKIDGMIAAIEHVALTLARPFLGICVGMQLMAEIGEEGGVKTAGFGWINGSITAMHPSIDEVPLKVPHMGWNQLIISDHMADDMLFDGLAADSRVYFLHGYHLTGYHQAGYHLTGGDDRQIAAWTDYGGHIVAAVKTDNLTGVQFHPEKSQMVGQRILANWLSYTC